MKSPSQVFENWFDDLPPRVQGEFALLFAMDVVQMFEDESLWGYDISIQRLKALLLRARQSRNEQRIMRIVVDYFDERLEYWQPHSLVPASAQQFIQQHRLHTQDDDILREAELMAQYERLRLEQEMTQHKMKRQLERWYDLESYFSDEYLSEYMNDCADKNRAELEAMNNVDTSNVYVLLPDL